jgi:hypothetical protein
MQLPLSLLRPRKLLPHRIYDGLGNVSAFRSALAPYASGPAQSPSPKTCMAGPGARGHGRDPQGARDAKPSKRNRSRAGAGAYASPSIPGPPQPGRCLDEGCGREHDKSRDEYGHAGVSQDFLENSGHCIPPSAGPPPQEALRPPPVDHFRSWQKGEICELERRNPARTRWRHSRKAGGGRRTL